MATAHPAFIPIAVRIRLTIRRHTPVVVIVVRRSPRRAQARFTRGAIVVRPAATNTIAETIRALRSRIEATSATRDALPTFNAIYGFYAVVGSISAPLEPSWCRRRQARNAHFLRFVLKERLRLFANLRKLAASSFQCGIKGLQNGRIRVITNGL
jgi:hypothetical protein